MIVILSFGGWVSTSAQGASRDSLLAAAREIIGQQHYCALITTDSTGRPHARTMNPFPPDDSMVVWMATNTRSHKVEEIRKNPSVCLYYADHSKATGEVVINGTAVLVKDPKEIDSHWREYWSQAFPDRQYLVLIKVVPQSIDVLNYRRGFNNDPSTFAMPSVVFPGP